MEFYKPVQLALIQKDQTGGHQVDMICRRFHIRSELRSVKKWDQDHHADIDSFM